MHFDEVPQAADAIVGEGRDAILAYAIDPDHTILWLHFAGELVEPALILAEFLGDESDGPDGMDLIALHQAAISIVLAWRRAFHFQGSNS